MVSTPDLPKQMCFKPPCLLLLRIFTFELHFLVVVILRGEFSENNAGTENHALYLMVMVMGGGVQIIPQHPTLDITI